MRFRSGDTILDRIRASLTRRTHGPARDPQRSNGRPVVHEAQITYYGRLGEMGHAEDRADDWPSADTGARKAT